MHVWVNLCWCVCVSGGRGGWNSSGCETESISPYQTSCLCDHLTHFAVLLVSHWSVFCFIDLTRKQTPTGANILCAIWSVLAAWVFFCQQCEIVVLKSPCVKLSCCHIISFPIAVRGKALLSVPVSSWCHCRRCQRLGFVLFVFQNVERTPFSKVNEQILTVVSYIGCGISSIFLGLTLLTYLIFE